MQGKYLNWQKNSDISDISNVFYQFEDKGERLWFSISNHRINFASNSGSINNQILEKSQELGVAHLFECHNDNPELIDGECWFNFVSENKEDYEKCIMAISAVTPFSIAIKQSLFDILGINTMAADTGELVNELKKISDEQELEKALKKASSVEQSESLYYFAKDCEEKQKWQYAIDSYQQINAIGDAAYSEKANHAIVSVINKLFDMADKGYVELTSEEKRQYLKTQLSCILAIGDPEDQRWIDRIYQELSEGQISPTPTVRNVKLDAETLFATTDVMLNLKKENAKLCAEIKALKSEKRLSELSSAKPSDKRGQFFSRKGIAEVDKKAETPTRARSLSFG